MNFEGEGARLGVLLKSGTVMAMAGNQAGNGQGRNDAGGDFRSMKTEDGDVAKGSRRRNAKNTIAEGNIAVTIGRDETSLTGRVGVESAIGKEMLFDVSCRCLSAITKVSTRSIEIIVTDFVDGILMDVARVIEDLM